MNASMVVYLVCGDAISILVDFLGLFKKKSAKKTIERPQKKTIECPQKIIERSQKTIERSQKQ